jgi:hypothetical protein
MIEKYVLLWTNVCLRTCNVSLGIKNKVYGIDL